MPTTILARLAKDWNDEDTWAKYRVLCGRLRADGTFGCGGELGNLVSASPQAEGTGHWLLAFGSGIVRGPDGVWQLWRRAQGRLRHNSRLASDPGTAPPVRDRAQRLLRDGVQSPGFMASSVTERPEGDDAGANGKLGLGPGRRRWRFPSTTLPCQVRCPRCNSVNSVEEDLIRQARERLVEEETWYRNLNL